MFNLVLGCPCLTKFLTMSNRVCLSFLLFFAAVVIVVIQGPDGKLKNSLSLHLWRFDLWDTAAQVGGILFRMNYGSGVGGVS
jgi:hypothetical protein